jgi:glucose-6-phosphate dehydrogenase assembly protein OpcA
MSPAQAELEGRGREYPERTRWVGEGVTADEIGAELDRLHRSAGGPDRILALARTLNLIVAPCPDRREEEVERALDLLGSHTPSRTLVLREHGAERIDATVIMECQTTGGAGRVGLCHDRVLLSMDLPRLEHSASLLAPLLVSDLPTVLWLPEPRARIPDPRLLERAQYVLVDSGVGTDDDLRRVASLTGGIRVHDLAWGRLEYWRAAVAAAFDRPEQRALLPAVTEVELRHGLGGFQAALLLAGWIAARAGWRPGRLERSNGRARASAVRDDGPGVDVSFTEANGGGDCGGVGGVVFRAESGEVDVDRCGATSSLRDLFAEALQPQPSFARGYAPAATAAAGMLEAAG